MTRKQALHSAIEALSANPAHSEAVQTLKGIIDDLPLTHWTEAAIEDAVEQYRHDHGCLPRPCEFKKRGLPQRTAIRNTYHMTVGQWLNQRYPSNAAANQDIPQTIRPSMTRKEALQLAVDILSEKPSAQETVTKLNEILENLPITRWTDSVIRDTVDQYTLDHGKLPNTKRFHDPGIKSLPRLLLWSSWKLFLGLGQGIEPLLSNMVWGLSTCFPNRNQTRTLSHWNAWRSWPYFGHQTVKSHFGSPWG
jgi:hypothetical protein